MERRKGIGVLVLVPTRSEFGCEHEHAEDVEDVKDAKCEHHRVHAD
jgi:hypothetical protein